MNLNQNLSMLDVLIIIAMTPILIYFGDSISAFLVWVAILYIPLSSAIYLLRWYLDR